MHSLLKVPCSNLAIKVAKQYSQVIWKLSNTIFTHPFHIKSSNEAYFSKYLLNCIDTDPPVYQPHTADIFKPAMGDPKQWRHDWSVRLPTMGISATCFPLSRLLAWRLHASRTFATLRIDQSLSISHCQCASNWHNTLMINHYYPKNNHFTRFYLFCFVLLLDVAVIKSRWSTRTPIVYDPLTFL